MRALFAALALWLLIPAAALSHAMPGSTVRLATRDGHFAAEVRIPLSELAAALKRPLPAAAVPAERAALETYLTDHLELKAGDGLPWGLRIEDLSTVREEDHDILVAKARFSRPAGPDQKITLIYDAVLREIPSHHALVYLEGGAGGSKPLGRLQSPLYDLVVAEVPPPAPAPKAKWFPGARDPMQWVYLALFLAALALAVRGYTDWRGRIRRRKT